jgi:hypothetical protein
MPGGAHPQADAIPGGVHPQADAMPEGAHPQADAMPEGAPFSNGAYCPRRLAEVWTTSGGRVGRISAGLRWGRAVRRVR